MFCPIERVELRVNHCPAKKCIYKDVNKQCAFDELTKDDLSVHEIAEVKGLKAYKVKSEVAQAKENLAIGMVVLRYSSYIQDSFPNVSDTLSKNSVQTVNEGEDQILEVLLNVFGLSEYQQNKFWDADRYTSWSARNKIEISLEDIKAVLVTVEVPTTS